MVLSSSGMAAREADGGRYRKVDLMLDTIYAELMEHASGSALDGWQFVTEKYGVKISKKAGKGGGRGGSSGLKGVGEVGGTPEEVFEVLWDVEKRQDWDKMVQTARVVREINSQCKLVYITLQGKLAVSPRDLCVLYSYRKLRNGSYVVMIRSIVHEEVPVVSGYVRAELLASGFVVEPKYKHEDIESDAMVGLSGLSRTSSAVFPPRPLSQSGTWDDNCSAPRKRSRRRKGHRKTLSDDHVALSVLGMPATSSLVTYVVQLDFKGWLPAMISDMLTMYQPLRISTLRSCVDYRRQAKAREAEGLSPDSAFLCDSRLQSYMEQGGTPGRARDDLFLLATSTPGLLHDVRKSVCDDDDMEGSSGELATSLAFEDSMEAAYETADESSVSFDSSDDEIFMDSVSDMTMLFEGRKTPRRTRLASNSRRVASSISSRSSSTGGSVDEEELLSCVSVLQAELEAVTEKRASLAGSMVKLEQQMGQELERRRKWEERQDAGKLRTEQEVQELLSTYLKRVGTIGEGQKKVDQDFAQRHTRLVRRLKHLSQYQDAQAKRQSHQSKYRVYWGCLVFVVLVVLVSGWTYRATGPMARWLRRRFVAAVLLLSPFGTRGWLSRLQRALIARVTGVRKYISGLDERLN